MSRVAWCLSLLVPAVLTVGVVCGTALPLGIPGEWVWLRQPPSATSIWLTLLPAAACGAGYVAFIGLGAVRAHGAKRWEHLCWLMGLAGAGFAWLWVVQEAGSEGYQLSKAAWVLYYPGPSGYFTAARTDLRSAGEFLASYERQMSEGEVLHIGTHPPGLTLFFRGLLAACASSPQLVELAIATEPQSVSDSMDLLKQLNLNAEHPFLRHERAALWLAALLAQGLAALTVLPLYGLLRHTCERTAAWLAASFWPAVPALAVFLPKSDAVFPFLAALFVLVWLVAVKRRSVTLGALAGALMWLSMLLSLAFLAVACFTGVLTLWRLNERNAADGSSSGPRPRLPGPRSLVRPLAGATLGLVVPCVFLGWLCHANLLSIWAWNLRNHSAFYGQFTRTYWKWLLVNPAEFAVALGPPLVALAAWGFVWQWKRGGWRTLGVPAALLTTWGALWLSGKNSGEAARLWIFLAPFVVWVAGAAFDESAATERVPARQALLSRAGALAALALQLAVCAALASQVGGFDFLR
ncbi:MAG: hypothetical protein ACT4QC_22415 [Planctomycetaceae bacterium]